MFYGATFIHQHQGNGMNKAIMASSIFSIALLSACGGGGTNNNIDDIDNNIDNNTPQPFAGAVNGVDPIVELTLKQPRSVQILSRTVLYTSEGGYEGDIRYITQHYSDGTSNEVFQLVTNISSLNIKDVQRQQSSDFSCSDGSSLKMNISSDFSSGEVITTGKHNGQNIDCKSSFASLLPTTVFDRQSITALLRGWGANYATADYSNCTHEIEDMNGFSKECVGEELVNYTITDDTGKIHKLTTKVSFK